MKKTNVLIVDQALEFGGSIVSTANLIRGIDRNLYRLVFMSSSSEALIRNKLRELGRETEVVIARKRLHYINSRKLFRRGRHSQNRVISLASILLAYGTRLMAHLGYMFTVAKTIKQHDIDIVQLNNGIDDEVAIVSRLLGVKQTAYIRGHVPLSKIQRQLFLPAVECFFSVSEYVRQDAIKDGIDPEKIVVATPPAIPEPIDHQHVAQLRERYGLHDTELTVGIFGRVLRWKGHKQFIHAAREVLARIPNVTFFIVGGKTDGCKESPSGRVIFEAMSQAKPVIASTLGGPREFIDDGVDGYLVNPHDTALLSQRIACLLEDEDLASQFSAAAQAKMDRSFNKQIYARRIEDCYQKITASTVPASLYDI